MITKTTAGKLIVAILLITSVILFISMSILFSQVDETKEKVYVDIEKQLQDFATFRFKAKYWIGMTNAISLANKEAIQEALKNNDRVLAKETLDILVQRIKQDTKFKNIKIHIHTKDNHSFFRQFKPEKYGDDLTSFRRSVVEVNRSKKPISGFEIGRAGLSMRAVVPVIDKYGNHLGSVEFIQGLNSVAKSFEKEQNGSFLLLMDLMSRSDDIETFTKSEAFQNNYIISQKYINSDFKQYASKIDMQKLLNEGYLCDDKYFYTYVDVKDFTGKKLGIALISKPITLVNYALRDAEDLIYTSLMIMVFMALSIAIFIIISSKKIIVYPIEKLQDGLDSFFAFVNKKNTTIDKLDESLSAEFGKMSKQINNNISVVAQTLKNDEIFAKELQETNIKIQQLLDNANQGFLYFDSDMIIGGEHSRVSEEIFEKNINGCKITELLYEDDMQNQTYNEESLKDILKEDGLRRDLMLSLLQTNFYINDKFIEVEYKILNENSFMLILTDVTEKKELDEKIKEEQQTLKMVVEVAITHEQFLEIKNDYEKFAIDIERFKSLEMLSDLRRYIHTYKGLFAQKEMLHVVKKLHSFEDIIDKSLQSDNLTEELFSTNSQDLLDWLELDLVILRDVLGDDYFENSNHISISKERIDSLYDKTKHLREISLEVEKLKYHNIKLFFRPYEKLVKQLAIKLEKEVNPLEIDSKDIYISAKYEPFLKSLVHIFRNCVDHGIETPEQREELGKDITGTITCKIDEKDENLYIQITDDGSGIDIKNIQQLILEKGLSTKEELEKLTEEETIMYIFEDDFSTADIVTDISGRGVGLSSILYELKNLNGEINIVNNFTKGIEFNFTISLNGEDEDA